MGCYIWYSEEGTGRGPSPPRPLLAVPNVTVHPSTASVSITVLQYKYGPLLWGFNVPIKGLKNWRLCGLYTLQHCPQPHPLLIQVAQLSQKAAQRSMSLETLFSYSRSLEIMLLRRALVNISKPIVISLILYCFWDSTSNRPNGVHLKQTGWGVIQCHWKWHHSIDRTRVSVGLP